MCEYASLCICACARVFVRCQQNQTKCEVLKFCRQSECPNGFPHVVVVAVVGGDVAAAVAATAATVAGTAAAS